MKMLEYVNWFIDFLESAQTAADTFLWKLFLVIHLNIFEPLYQSNTNAWFYFASAFTITWLSTLKLSRLLPDQSSWQLTIIRLLICKSFVYFSPIGLFLWFVLAFTYSGSGLEEEFFSSIVRYLVGQKEHFAFGGLIGLFGGFAAILFIGRFVEPSLDRWLSQLTKKSTQDHKHFDVRQVADELPKPTVFDPYQFFATARKNKALFFGKNAKDKAIFISRVEWLNSNILLLGPTRRGKGVQACMVLAQCLFFEKPDIIVVIDPKCDDWGPLVLKDACQRAKLPFVYINARRGQSPQYNLLKGTTKDDLIAMLVAGYDLYPKGSPDDFYRTLEQEAVEQLVENCSAHPTIAELYALSLSLFTDKEAENIQSLLSKLKQDSKLESINSQTGPSIDDLLTTGGVFWFVGSEDDPSVIRIQRMFAYRAVQFFRNRTDKGHHGTIFADELKHLISGPFYKAFGTILGAGNANIIAAIQSKGDLEDIPQNLNPRAVSKTIFDNTNLKWCYRTHDPETVEWICKMEGTQVITKERHAVERNMQLAETSNAERSISKEETGYLHRNQIFHLPNSCAVLIGHGIAQIAYTSPIKVKKEPIEPTHVQENIEPTEDNNLGDALL